MRKARVLAVAALVAFSGCSGGGDGGGGTGPTPVFTSLSVTPANVSVVVNGTQNLTVSAKDQNGATMSGLSSTFQSNDVEELFPARSQTSLGKLRPYNRYT